MLNFRSVSAEQSQWKYKTSDNAQWLLSENSVLYDLLKF